MSGVWVWAVRARNWERREVISEGERPAEARRSNPRGSVVVVVVVVCHCCCCDRDCGRKESVDDSRALAFAPSTSRVRAEGERVWVVETEQWI